MPRRPGLENAAASSTVLGRTSGLKGTAKASQNRFSGQGFASPAGHGRDRRDLEVWFVCDSRLLEVSEAVCAVR